MEEQKIPENYPVQVRPNYTAVQVPEEKEEEEQDIALVRWVKSNFFAILGLLASLVTLYASSQVRPITQELSTLKEDMLEVKTANAQVLGVMDTKYATKEVVEIKYDNLKESIDDLNESVQKLTDAVIKEKK